MYTIHSVSLDFLGRVIAVQYFDPTPGVGHTYYNGDAPAGAVESVEVIFSGGWGVPELPSDRRVVSRIRHRLTMRLRENGRDLVSAMKGEVTLSVL